jgi:hypothetical protein
MSIPALMLAGGVSGVTSRFATHPFDTIKTQMQVQGAVRGSANAAAYTGVLDGARKILAREGAFGFYRGFGAVFSGRAAAMLPLSSLVEAIPLPPPRGHLTHWDFTNTRRIGKGRPC